MLDMDRERQASGLACRLNHASNAHPTERLATLIDEVRGRNFRNGVSRRDGTASLDAPRLQVPAFPRQD